MRTHTQMDVSRARASWCLVHVPHHSSRPRRVSPQELRGDDKTFAGESRKVFIPAFGSGPIATAAHTGRKMRVVWPETVKIRRALAAEFNLGIFTFVPCTGGVLEYGFSH